MINMKNFAFFSLVVAVLIVFSPVLAAAQVEGSADVDVEASFGGDDLSSDEEQADSMPADSDEDEDVRAIRFRRHNTWEGPVGGIHVVDAGSGPPGTFRLQLGLDFMSTSDFIRPGDVDDYLGGVLTFNWSILDFLETYLAVMSHGNYNTLEDPEFTQVLGDARIGFKGFYEVLPWLTIGGDIRVEMLNTVGDLGILSSATGFGLRANISADFQRLKSKTPLIARFNFGYYFDNSAELVADIEAEKLDVYMARADAQNNPNEEWRHLTSPAERFAQGINRTDIVSFALGIEAPLNVTDDFYLNPILEWTWGIPANRQSFECIVPYDFDDDLDSCLDMEGIGAFPMDMTLGLRVLPPVKGLAALLGVDLGLSGTTIFVRELAPNNPYKLIFMLSYAYDTREPKPEIREVFKEAPAVEAAPKTGRVYGVVVEKGAGTTIANATITYPGRELTSQVSSADGRFTSYALEPGEVQFEVSHPDYETGKCSATIPSFAPAGQPEEVAQPAAQPDAEAQSEPTANAAETAETQPEAEPAPVDSTAASANLDVELRCELVAKPRQGSIDGKVVGPEGQGISGAKIELSGPQTATLTSDAAGAFKLEQAPLGSYSVRVESDGYFVKQQDVVVTSQGAASVQISLMAKPKTSMVKVGNREIFVRRRIQFSKDSAAIEPNSEPLLAELADVLLRNPQIRLVEIQGHTDDRGGAKENEALSQRQADAIRDWLVQAGVPSARLEAKGYGQSRPLVPNLTPANRARNRRVQFIIKEQ